MLKTTLAITATLATLALTNPAIAAPADFIGTWVNTDSNTRGITKVIIQPYFSLNRFKKIQSLTASSKTQRKS